MASRIHWIAEPEQIEALGSRVRQRIVDRLEAIGPASVAALATALGVPPDRLYYHAHRLAKHRIIQQVGTEGEGREKSAVFDVIARRWHLKYDAGKAAVVAALRKVTASMLRQAKADFDAGWSVPGVALRGTHRTLWSLRLEASLSRAELAELNTHLQAIVDLLRRPRRSEQGRMVALTWVLAPVGEEPP